MEYVTPAGALPGASYIDGDRSAGIKGSIVPAAAIEDPMREILNVITHAGLTPAKSDLEQLRKAIEAIIDARTGGGATEDYLLLTQAASRLLFFPEVLSSDGKINVTSPTAGTILVPTSVQFLQRGVRPYSTSDYIEDDRTFSTTGGKTYHLRWNPADGFVLRDVADLAYNPDLVSETDARFDSSYDDMLIARIVTNSSNVATITNLANKHVLRQSVYRDYLLYPAGGLDQPAVGAAALETIPINMARSPMFQMNGFEESSMGGSASAIPGGGADGSETNIIPSWINRYSASIFAFSYNDRLGRGGRPRYYATFFAL